MAPTVPLDQAVQSIVAAAPNQRIKHAELVAQLQQQGYRNFGLQLVHMWQGGAVTARTEIEDNKGVLYYTPKSA